MIKTKDDIRGKCIFIPKKTSSETLGKINRKFKSLGLDDNFLTLRDVRYGCSVVINKKCQMSWFGGIVENISNGIELEGFLEER